MIETKLREDLKTAMRAKESEKVLTLRALISALQNQKISSNKDRTQPLTEHEEISVLRAELKKRREAADVYKQAGKEDMYSQEASEAKIIESYLPSELSDEELQKVVTEAIDTHGKDNIGLLMKDILPKVAGRADGARIKKMIDAHQQS